MHTSRFAALTARSAPEAARPLITASEKQFGFVPSPVAKAARSPALLKFLLAGFGAFDHTSLAPLEREVVALTVAFENECHYCMAMHSALLSGAPENAALVQALRDGSPLPDPRLEALRSFVRALVRERGRVPTDRWKALEAAGFTEEQALDALLGAAVYWLSTVTNAVTEADLDAPFVPFRWERPDARSLSQQGGAGPAATG